MDKPAEIFAELTTGADPWAWVYLAIAIMVAAITGLSPSEARRRTFSRDTPWIQCQTTGTVLLFGFVLYWFGLWAVAVATNPRDSERVTWAYLGWWGDMALRCWSLPIAGRWSCGSTSLRRWSRGCPLGEKAGGPSRRRTR